MKVSAIATIGAFATFCSTLPAQVPQMINYQGRVVVGTANFNGTGQFRFALVNTNGSTTYWSNDGTSANGSQPTNPVSLTVTNGLYSVLLGDASLTNMTAIPASVFNNADVRLRVWFNDGTNGSQLLSPDQRVASVGYAVMAGNVPDGAITGAKIANGTITSADIANGAIGTAQLGTNAVTSAKIAAGAITTTQLAANAVTAANIANGSITATQLAKPPRSGTISSSGLTFMFGQAPFSVTFSPTFNTTPNVTVALEGATLEQSVAVTSKSTTGFSGQWSLQSPIRATVDGSSIYAGYGTSLLGSVNGFPAISYSDLSANKALKYVRATDTYGGVWGSPVTVISGDANGVTTLVVVNGNPAIGYFGINDELRYVRATNATGTAWGASVTVASSVPFGETMSLAVVNGNPAFAYYDFVLRYVRATDANGTNWGSPIYADSGADGQYPSLVIVGGNPAISYCDTFGGSLKYVRATDANGSAWGTPVTIDSTGVDASATSLAIVNGNPAISYYDTTNGDLKYVRATDANGTTWGAPVTVDSVGNVGQYSSLAIVGGNPAISYYDVANADLKYVRATDANGTSWPSPVAVDFTGSVGSFNSLKIVFTAPAIAYFDATNGHVKFVSDHYQTPPTSTLDWIALEP